MSCYFLLCFIASWTWVVVSVMLYPCIFCVVLLMDLFVLFVACLTVLVNCLGKQFAMCLGLVAVSGLEITGFASQFASQNQPVANQINI